MLGTAYLAGAKYHKKPEKLDSMPLLKYKRLAHKNALAAKKNFERWGFDEEKRSRHGRHLASQGFSAWLDCQQEQQDACPELDTEDKAYWRCYSVDDGCDSEVVNAPGWYDCFWMGECPEEPVPLTESFEDEIEEQPSTATAEGDTAEGAGEDVAEATTTSEGVAEDAGTDVGTTEDAAEEASAESNPGASGEGTSSEIPAPEE